MADPVDFEGANDVLLAPPALKEYCHDLPICRTAEGVISAWRLSPEEVQKVRRTGVIWFYAVGRTHPPIIIGADPLHTHHGREPEADPVLPRAPKR